MQRYAILYRFWPPCKTSLQGICIFPSRNSNGTVVENNWTFFLSALSVFPMNHGFLTLINRRLEAITNVETSAD